MKHWLPLLVLVAACSKEEAQTKPPGSSAPRMDPRHLVDAAWLREHRDEVVLVDMASKRAQYETGHIAGAVHVVVKNLRDEDKNLLRTAELAKKLGSLGIREDSYVVAYDRRKGSDASILWYALMQLGHEHVSLLDGGMAGFANELEQGEGPRVEPVHYRARKDPENVVDSEWIEARLDKLVFLDARVPAQYTGEKPKKGIKPGHLPGAINLTWDRFVGADGRYLGVDEARALLPGVNLEQEIVLYCNTYRQASHVHFHLHRIGFTNIKAWDGSIQQWQEVETRPLKMGDQP